MSGYRGRTGPNFSQYLNDLNTLSPPEQQFVEDADLSNDLAMYTNTDFTNLDMPFGEDSAFNFDLSPEAQGHEGLKYEELLSASTAPTDFSEIVPIDTTTPAQSQPYYSTYNTPIQPAPSGGFPPSNQKQQSPIPRDTRRARTDTIPPVDHMSPDDKSRMAAEEDKRRRNTAASARFRVKKKQREQALERTLKDSQDKSQKLEMRVQQLEQENKWLRDLITDKNGLQSKEEMAAAYEKHRKESEERDLKQEPGRTSGVGTD
ncbi:hypothetical protein LTS08_005555 [Lithohypha guttulata]|nr:hypothetical protein LTS08_005555 [Lithohypha guttulata]